MRKFSSSIIYSESEAYVKLFYYLLKLANTPQSSKGQSHGHMRGTVGTNNVGYTRLHDDLEVMKYQLTHTGCKGLAVFTRGRQLHLVNSSKEGHQQSLYS